MVFSLVVVIKCVPRGFMSLHWRHNGRDGVSNHQHQDCLLKHLLRRKSKKTSKLRVTGLCAGNSPETVEFPAQMASNAENASIWWRHHVIYIENNVGDELVRCLCYQWNVILMFISRVAQQREKLIPQQLSSGCITSYSTVHTLLDLLHGLQALQTFT